ncbi:MAG: HAD family hydrolase [Deltaproteobacteria bacterium]|jgi:phosphoglycolate phosphatase|nr:HAD family hydrolase [Deltaproteobacteria bacterium]
MTLALAAVIFDLDGTLIASLEDIADAVNTALAAHALPTHPLEPYKRFVGDGMEMLARRASPRNTPEAVVASVYARVKEEYGRNWANKTRPYEGVPDMLARLAERGVPMAVLSNKPHEFTGEVVRHFFPDAPFAVAQGNPGGGKAKPDPALALSIAGKFSLAPSRIGFMGDSSTDMDTAVNAGMPPIGALWGFRPESELREHGARVLLAHPSELFEKTAPAAP